MNVDKNSEYFKRISSRSFFHFFIGLLPRLHQWLIFQYILFKAKKRGAHIGKESVIINKLAKRANENLTIGDYSSIGSYKFRLRSPITIGNHVIISSDCVILTTSHQIDSPEWKNKYYGLTIDDYVWIAANAIILPSCRHIGYGAVIGAGAVVVRNVEPMSVVGGNPATVIKRRKQIHDKLIIPSLLGYDLKEYWYVWTKRK